MKKVTIDPKEYSVGFISLGCAKNQVDSELMIGKLAERGFNIVNNPEDAQVIVINTCAFIESAREEAINTILEMSLYRESGLKALVVTGCLSERYTEEIKSELPEVDAIVGINSCADIADVVVECFQNASDCPVTDVSDEYGTDYMEGPRVLTTPSGSAFLKIAEGCDNKCTYCAIPIIRGPMRSRSIENIVSEAQRLAASGVKELNIIAQDTTRYGLDIYGSLKLSELITKLDSVDGIEWLRLLYMYPDEIDFRLINALSSLKKFVHYIDLPLQHISDRVLPRMNRRGTSAQIKEAIVKLKNLFPDAILRTSFIVGFPGETEEDFSELCSFVEEFRFQRIGVFTYSPEEGTKACEMDDQVPEEIKQDRYDRLMSLAQKISLEENQKRVGTVADVLVESVAEDGIFYVGRSYAEAPDSDGKIYFTSDEPLNPGDMVKVEILIAEEYDLTGCVVVSR